uniref:Uncharacterized protein n=1 Tax=Amphimedon queenslandica TaxID=400682 RepID=A0A1X7VDN7_AMPQE
YRCLYCTKPIKQEELEPVHKACRPALDPLCIKCLKKCSSYYCEKCVADEQVTLQKKLEEDMQASSLKKQKEVALSEKGDLKRMFDARQLKLHQVKEQIVMAQGQTKDHKDVSVQCENHEKLEFKAADMEKEEQYLKEKQIIIADNQNLKAEISDKDKVIAKLTLQVEEQSQNEKQIITDLKANKLYAAKLMKEKSQLQERVTSLEDQSIKETSSIGLQFNYLIPSIDSLDSSVIIAGKKLFILQGDRSHSLHWEKYGFRLECPQGAVSKDTEIAVIALAGGNFKVPKGTVLVSAVYAISVSKALLKPLVIELQHCVDLRNTSQIDRLKFVRAPLKSPDAYQFSIVEGGSFNVRNRYGSIERDEFSAFGIGYLGNGDISNGNGNEAEDDTQSQGTDNDSDEETNGDTPNDSSNGVGENSSGARATPSTNSINDDPSQLVNEVESHTTDDTNTTEQSSDILSDCDKATTTISSEQCPAKNDDESLQSSHSATNHSIAENAPSHDILYSGMMYYKKKEVNHWKAMYSVVRDLEVLKTYLESKQSSIEYDDETADPFKFIQPNGTLKLVLETTPPQLGWTVDPDKEPMELFQSFIEHFSSNPSPSHATCSISVYAEIGVAKKPLHYPIKLTGIDPSKIVYINKSLPAMNNSLPHVTDPSSNKVHESTSVSSNGGASPSATVDVNKVKKVINDVLVSHYADLNSLPKKGLSELANQLYTVCLVNNAVKEAPLMKECINEFQASLSFKRKVSQVQEHCQKFLSSFNAVRGSYADAAIALREDWIEAIRNELRLNFDIDNNA